MASEQTPVRVRGEQATMQVARNETLVDTIAARLQVPVSKVFPILRDTVFKVRQGEAPFSDNEVAAALHVAARYDLDPLTKDFYAIRNPKGGGLLLIMGVDGWLRILHRTETFKGLGSFEYEYDDKGAIVSCTGTMHDSRWDYPLTLTEYFSECHRDTDNWRKSPHRMMRNRVLCQLVRVGCGVGGVLEEDEAQAMSERPVREIQSQPVSPVRDMWRRSRARDLPPPESPPPTEAASSDDDPPMSEAEIKAAFTTALAGHGNPDSILEQIGCPTLATVTTEQAAHGLRLVREGGAK